MMPIDEKEIHTCANTSDNYNDGFIHHRDTVTL